jgi:hypothetical protein
MLATLVVAGALCGCKRGLPSGEQSMDFSSLGLNVALTAPPAGTTGKNLIGGSPYVAWDEGRGETGHLDFERGKASLECTTFEDDCKILQKDDASSVRDVSINLFGTAHRFIHATANVAVGGAPFHCSITAQSADDARRLVAACLTAKATGPLDAPQPAAGNTAAPAAGVASAAPSHIELEDRTIVPMACSIRTPKGSKVLSESALTSKYSLPLPGGAFDISVEIVASGETSLENAKTAATRFGIEHVSDAKKLGSGLLEVVNEPRGVLQSVSTYAPHVSARCQGPVQYLADLTAMCESLAPRKAAGAAQDKKPTAHAKK